MNEPRAHAYARRALGAWLLVVAACSSSQPASQPAAATETPATAAGSGARAGGAASAEPPVASGVSAPASSAGTRAAPAVAGMSVQPAAAGMSSPAIAGSSAPAAAGSGMLPSAAGAAGLATSAAGTPAPSAGDDSPMPSPGCMGGSLEAGRSMGMIQSSGGNRSYIQYLPQGYDGKKPVPLVVDLHPFSVGASFAESSSGFRQLADSERYAYLAPQGLSNMWDSTGDTDEKFIRDLVNDVAMKGCIDLRRVYATGCSNGGAFSFLLMCTAEDIFAAVAPMCGTAFFDLQTMCMMDRPVSLMLRIGKQDTLNCWEGEGMTLDAPNVAPGTKVACAKTVQKIMGDKYHCKGQPKMMAECEYLGDCDEGTEIAICDENTGHVVYETNTAKDTWAFLKRFYKH